MGVVWAHRNGVSQELDGGRRRIQAVRGVIVCSGKRRGVAGLRRRGLAASPSRVLFIDDAFQIGALS
jgi:hypothetical protein